MKSVCSIHMEAPNISSNQDSLFWLGIVLILQTYRHCAIDIIIFQWKNLHMIFFIQLHLTLRNNSSMNTTDINHLTHVVWMLFCSPSMMTANCREWRILEATTVSFRVSTKNENKWTDDEEKRKTDSWMSSQHCFVHRPLKRVTHKFIPVVERSVEIISNIELIRYRNTKHTNSFIIKFSNNFGDLFTFFVFYSHHLHHIRFSSILNRTNNVTCSNHSFFFLSFISSKYKISFKTRAKRIFKWFFKAEKLKQQPKILCSFMYTANSRNIFRELSCKNVFSLVFAWLEISLIITSLGDLFSM